MFSQQLTPHCWEIGWFPNTGFPGWESFPTWVQIPIFSLKKHQNKLLELITSAASKSSGFNINNPKVIVNNKNWLIGTRQNLKFLDYDVDYSDFLNGGFIISKGEDLTIFASGSEVNLALKIKETLKTPIIRQ